MINWVVRSGEDLARLAQFISDHPQPFSCAVASGVKRTNPQNALQRKWVGEVATFLGDRTAEEIRGHCKLHFGVPIMRRDNDVFCEKYDRLIKPLSYEEKIELMMEPMDFPVTRFMTTKQKAEYLDAMCRYWRGKGVPLTDTEGRQ